MWSWTADKVLFEDEKTVLKASKEICILFTDEIPLVDRGSMRLKIARLSAALAARTFSTKNGGVYVRNCHVEYIERFLIEVYSTKAFGYREYTEKMSKAEIIVSPKMIESKIRDKIGHPEIFVEHLLLSEEVNIFFIQDILGIHPDSARELFNIIRGKIFAPYPTAYFYDSGKKFSVEVKIKEIDE